MLLVMKMFNRWMTFETGVVGEENEPEIEKPEEEEIVKAESKLEFGYTMPDMPALGEPDDI